MTLSETDRRVLYVSVLMQTGEWETQRLKLYRRLCREWGCSRDSVEQIATQAARFLRLDQAKEKTG